MRQSRLRVWAASLYIGVGKSEEQRAQGFWSRRWAPPPPVSGCSARGLTERQPPRGLEGRKPRPRGGRPGARGPTAATQWRPPQAPRAPAAASPPYGGGAGRFQSRPTQWGRGEERGPSSSSVRGGYITLFSETPLSCPGHPQRPAVPDLGVPAKASAAAFPPHSPVDAIFSPSSSFSQRPSPSPFPPRRRTAQARSPQPRALPSGRATGGDGLDHRRLAFPPATPAPTLRQGRRLGRRGPQQPSEAPAGG